MCKTASQQITVLKPIGQYLKFESKSKAFYHAFIMSVLNFYPLILHFCSIQKSEKLEKISHRALKFVFQDFQSSYEELINKAGTCTLHVSRIRTIAIEIFWGGVFFKKNVHLRVLYLIISI